MHFTTLDWVVVAIAGMTVWLTFQRRKNHKDALVDVFRDIVLWLVVYDTLGSDCRTDILILIGAVVTLSISIRRAWEAFNKPPE